MSSKFHYLQRAGNQTTVPAVDGAYHLSKPLGVGQGEGEGGGDTRRGRETMKDFQGYLSSSCVQPAGIGNFHSTLGSREPPTTLSLTEDIPRVKYHFYVKRETFSSSIIPQTHPLLFLVLSSEENKTIK